MIEKDAAYNLQTTCPLARWTSLGGEQFAYVIEGLPACATVLDGNGSRNGWEYIVTCAAFGRQFTSRYETSDYCIDRVRFLLEQIGCPGQFRDPVE